MAGPIKTGTIEKIDSESQTGFIVSDEDDRLIYFALADVLKDIGLVIPPALTGPSGMPLLKDGVPVLVDGHAVTTLFNLPPFLICLALAGLLVLGVSESAKFNNIIVAIKVSVLVAFIVVGGSIVLAHFSELSAKNWVPFIPPLHFAPVTLQSTTWSPRKV